MATIEHFTAKSLVLVTGANGHVAQHVVEQLLCLPEDIRPQVRGTYRSPSSAKSLEAVFASHIAAGNFQLVQVKDMVQMGAFDEVLDGCTHVAHIASPLVVGSTNAEEEVLKPAMKGTTSLLESCSKSSTLRAVVITGSFASVMDPAFGLRPGYTYTPKDWNPISYEQAADPGLDLSPWPSNYQKFLTYMASKKLAEKAAWDFYDSAKPQWSLSFVLPTYIGGPSILPLTKGPDSLSFSNGLIWKVATAKSLAELPEDDFPNWVDVRDVANAHIQALLHSSTANSERFILCSGMKMYKDMAKVVGTLFEERGLNPPVQQKEQKFYQIESTNCEHILGITEWSSFDKMVHDTVQQVLDAEGTLGDDE